MFGGGGGEAEFDCHFDQFLFVSDISVVLLVSFSLFGLRLLRLYITIFVFHWHLALLLGFPILLLFLQPKGLSQSQLHPGLIFLPILPLLPADLAFFILFYEAVEQAGRLSGSLALDE